MEAGKGEPGGGLAKMWSVAVVGGRRGGAGWSLYPHTDQLHHPIFPTFDTLGADLPAGCLALLITLEKFVTLVMLWRPACVGDGPGTTRRCAWG